MVTIIRELLNTPAHSTRRNVRIIKHFRQNFTYSLEKRGVVGRVFLNCWKSKIFIENLCARVSRKRKIINQGQNVIHFVIFIQITHYSCLRSSFLAKQPILFEIHQFWQTWVLYKAIKYIMLTTKCHFACHQQRICHIKRDISLLSEFNYWLKLYIQIISQTNFAIKAWLIDTITFD